MKFIFVYFDGGNKGNVAPEQVYADWTEWFSKLGAKVIDGGSPFSDKAKKVSLDSVSEINKAEELVSGYSIVEAKDMEEATQLAKDCPILKHSEGKGRVEVYEALPM